MSIPPPTHTPHTHFLTVPHLLLAPPPTHTLSQTHGTHAWLVNTGWTGGRYGVGKRMSIGHTRAIIDAIHSGELEAAEYSQTPIFHLQVCLCVV